VRRTSTAPLVSAGASHEMALPRRQRPEVPILSGLMLHRSTSIAAFACRRCQIHAACSIRADLRPTLDLFKEKTALRFRLQLR